MGDIGTEVGNPGVEGAWARTRDVTSGATSGLASLLSLGAEHSTPQSAFLSKHIVRRW